MEDIFAAVEWAKKEAFTDDSVPVFLLGESFGGLQVLVAALDSKDHGVELAGVIVLGGLIKVAEDLVPPRFVIKILSWLAPYYSLMKMPATDMSKTFDEAFGDPEWAAVCRTDPAVKVSPQSTLGAAAATLATGDKVLARARELDVPLLAVHGVHDCRVDFDAVHQFVDQAGSDAEGFWIEDTTGHQLLQDRKEVTDRVMEKVADWIVKQVQSSK